MAQQVIKKSIGKGFGKALKFVAKYFGIALLIFIFIEILAVILHIFLGIPYVEITIRVPWFTIFGFTVVHDVTYQVDYATVIFVGMIDLILQVFHTLALLIGMAVIWIFNMFVIGRDGAGEPLFPLSIINILSAIPLIGDFFVSVKGISDSVIVNLNSLLTTIDDLFYGISASVISTYSDFLVEVVRNILGRID